MRYIHVRAKYGMHFVIASDHTYIDEWLFDANDINIVGCPEERHKCLHSFAGNSSFCQAHAFEVLTPTSTYRQGIICMFYLSKFIPSNILSSNVIFCNFVYNANGIFKSWEFYRSLPFAGNKCSIHVFLPGAYVHVILPGTCRHRQLRARRALLLYIVYGGSALLVLSWR